MNKNTQMLLGLGAIAVVGYLVYQQMNKKMPTPTESTDGTTANFANLTSRTSRRKTRRSGGIIYGGDYINTPATAYPDVFLGNIGY